MHIDNKVELEKRISDLLGPVLGPKLIEEARVAAVETCDLISDKLHSTTVHRDGLVADELRDSKYDIIRDEVRTKLGLLLGEYLLCFLIDESSDIALLIGYDAAEHTAHSIRHFEYAAKSNAARRLVEVLMGSKKEAVAEAPKPPSGPSN